ncbi:PA14 domain-containing protein [Flavobacterium muglaense]|uniref:T9SS sorting signal type C domain-containing protein n=1 Tax=Flavobacterium muglaense TaxID=2764716 RepID=A0A923N063_9FLAO|nr:PA14 domain-containing protein [Flavobacterium muglaense]MBC5839089.1 T9SS sorting signal type C domain-containing protein [Flavobacterium muglaense]MBC5845568.1 T9SS sorting signal type C domain-containing protein [Flavobacterium muglaense]
MDKFYLQNSCLAQITKKHQYMAFLLMIVVSCSCFGATYKSIAILPPTYCGGINFDGATPITNVTIAGIANSSSRSTTVEYENYTSIIGNVCAGQTGLSISIEGNTVGNYTVSAFVYIDWNQNGILDDAGESYYIGNISNSTGIDGKVASSIISVPSGATSGNTRMRVVFRDRSVNNPCVKSSSYEFGQTEDYTINVNQAPVGLSYTLGSPVYCRGSAIATNSASLSTPGTPSSTYTVSPALPAGLSISSTTGAITGTPTVAVAAANYTVSATNSCGVATVILNITVNAAPATPGTITQPTNKCASTTGNTFSIAAVTGATSYAWSVTGTGWSVTAGGTTTSATITIGSGAGTVSVTATNACGTSSSSSTGSITPTTAPSVPGSSSPYTFTCNGFTAQWGPHYLSTSYYIDVATNSSFSAGTILSSYDNLNVGNVQFLVLSGLSSGTTYYYRVRASNACGTSGNSGTMSGTTTGPTIGTTSSNQSVCSGNSPADITLTGSTGAVQWQSSVDNSSFSNISGATSSVLSSAQIGVLTATRYYRAILTNSGCTSYSTVVTVTVTASTLSTTGPTICVGGSGTLTASGVCGSVFTNSGTAFSGAWTGTSDPTAFRPTFITNSATCSFSTTTRNYVATVFQVSVTGNYTFSMDQNGNYDGMGYITTGSFVPGNCSGGGSWIIGDDDSNGNFEPRMNALFTAGVTYTLISTTYGTSNISDSFSWTVSPPVGGQIMLETSSTIQWYTNSTGGTAIGSGTPFNPVGVAGSGLANTNTAGTTIFYAACSTNPGCRTATSFTINSSPTIAAITTPAALCSGGLLNPTAPTVTANGSTVTASGWQLETGVGTGTFANLTLPYTVAFSDNGKNIRYYATNGCGTTNTNQVVITVNNVPTIVAITAPAALCSGGVLNPTAPTVTANGLTVTASGWQLETGVGSGTFANLTLPYTVAFADNGKKIRYYATNGCGTTNSNEVTIKVDNLLTAPTVGTRTHPTCAVATGSVVLSGLPSGAWALTQDPGSITTTGTGSSTTVSGLSAGTYNFSVIDANNGTGLTGDYFSNMALTGTPTLTRTDVSVNYDWGGGSPDSSIPADGFSVRWSGQVQARYSETYTFSTISDDGVRLWVNGVQIINNWTDHGPTTDTGTIALTAGVKYSIVLEYYENGGGALCQLIWNSTSQGNETIPQSQLFPSSGCTALLSADVVINAQPATPAAPSIGTITNIDCVNATGSVVLNGLPASGSWTINPGAITGTGTSHTITGLTGGSYVYTVTNASGCTSAATSAGGIMISNNAAVTWNGTAWSNGTGPTSASNIIFNGNYSSTGDLYGCSCEVSTGTSVAFNSGDSMIITNQVRVLGTGTLSFDDTASLVQINNTPTVANSGVITYTRITTPISNFDYTYWSSPVVGQILYDVSPLTLLDKFYSYNSFTNNWQQENVGGAMTAGTGYIIRGPQTHMAPSPPSAHMVNFSGAPHNGIINKAIGGAGSSVLIGNPYPSAIDADTFINANTAVIDGTLYFWTHNTSIQLASNITNGTAGSGTYAYTSDDYAAYNLTGGVGTAPAPSSTNAGSVSTIAPTGKIAAGQAFFTSSVAAGNVVFNNGMRIGGGGSAANNSQFFKMASSKTNKVIEKNRLWLDLYNSQGAFKQTLIGYITGATNDYENAYDGESYNSNAYLDFYSVTKDKNLVVQGRALPFVDEDEVPIGFTTKVAGTFEIAMSKTDGLLANKNVFLKDKLLNTTHNLKTKPYSFTTEKGTFDQRFVIVYADKTLATDDFEESVSGVVVSTKNKEIQIKSADELIGKVFVYDFTGKLIYTKTGISNTEHKISNLIVGDKVLIVKIIFENGGAVSKKVIY